MKSRIIIAVLVSITILFSLNKKGCLGLDGIGGNLLSLYFGEDTMYSLNYSDKGFSKVKIGMDKDEVIQLLGNPVSYWNPYRNTIYKEREDWAGMEYSFSPSDTHYRLRRINLEDNKVSEIINYFYLD